MEIVCTLITIYIFIVLVRIVLSWFPIDPDGPVATFHGLLHLLTDPLLSPLRRAIPPVRLGSVALDLSAIIVIIGLQVLQGVLCG